LSGVGYLRIPKDMNQNKLLKNKKIKTNGTIDFINGQKNFLSKSIYNLNPKLGDLLIFPNYLMHTAYPFNVDGERRSFSFNAKILFKKWFTNQFITHIRIEPIWSILQVLTAKKEIIKKLVRVVELYCAPGIKPKH